MKQNNPLVWRYGGLFLLLGALCLLATTGVSANVELQYFRATAGANGVALEWKTGSEIDTGSGAPMLFYVKRALTPDSFAPVDPNNTVDSDTITVEDDAGENVQLIPASGSSTGATYTAFDADDDLIDGQTYYYLLVEIESDNDKVAKTDDIASATAGVTVTPTPEATQVGLPTPTSPASVTATPVPPTATSVPATATPVPATATATPRATNTPQATNTPALQPTATPTLVPPTPTLAQNPVQAPTNTPAATATPATVSAESTAPPPGVPVAEAAAQAGYPGEPSPTPTPDAGYPADQGPGDLDNSGTPNNGDEAYTGENGSANGVIGEQSDSVAQLPDPAPSTADETSGSNRAILWVGFLAALLVFGAGVFGSIVIFTRKRSD